ncbi:MAG: thermonuclease family protein [Pseudomonadota bacterium]
MSATILAACLIIGISDGDTLTAMCNQNEQIKIRLAEIDAPEKIQPFGQRSKQSLAEMCFKKPAEIQVQATDRYHRSVARVTCNGVDANAEQIRRGMAWVYDKYNKDRSFYELQNTARNEQRGLWADQSPIPPWEWRHSRKP